MQCICGVNTYKLVQWWNSTDTSRSKTFRCRSTWTSTRPSDSTNALQNSRLDRKICEKFCLALSICNVKSKNTRQIGFTAISCVIYVALTIAYKSNGTKCQWQSTLGRETCISDRMKPMSPANPWCRSDRSTDPEGRQIWCLQTATIEFIRLSTPCCMHDQSSLTLIKRPRCMTVNGVQQCADNVTPTSDGIVALHKIECNECQENSGKTWRETHTNRSVCVLDNSITGLFLRDRHGAIRWFTADNKYYRWNHSVLTKNLASRNPYKFFTANILQRNLTHRLYLAQTKICFLSQLLRMAFSMNITFSPLI